MRENKQANRKENPFGLKPRNGGKFEQTLMENVVGKYELLGNIVTRIVMCTPKKNIF